MVKRTHWDNRAAFVLAAIGSAIGLGNIWRFPYICYKYGGGAFLFAYIIVLLIIGIPLLLLEFAIGRKYHASAPAALSNIKFNLTGIEGNEKCKSFKGNFEWAGWFALIVAFIITTYYSVVMGWSFNYFFYSFRLSWGTNTAAFFHHNVLGLTDNVFHFGKIQWPIVAALFVCWLWIIYSIRRGAKSVGKIVYYTVTIPWLILIIFVIRGLTLPGAAEGIRYYLTPKWKMLLNPDLWHAALTQVFFSLSIGLGIMIAYASFLPPKSDIVNNALLISLANSATSYVGGFAVFSTLGYYAHLSGVGVGQVMKSGPELAFITYPTIINHLPFAPVFGILFFLMLLTLAIDSAFSLVEGGVAGLRDKFGYNRVKANIGYAIAAFVVGILYTTGAGLYWLDIVDHFMNNFGLLLVVLFETIAVGYFMGADRMRKYANSISEMSMGKWWNISIKYILPIAALILLIFSFIEVIKAPYGGYPRLAEFLGGWLLLIICFVGAFLLAKKKGRNV